MRKFRKRSGRRSFKRRSKRRRGMQGATFRTKSRAPKVRSRVSKRSKVFHISNTRRFPTQSLALSRVAAMADTQFPCLRLWSDAVLTARCAAQCQGWFAMMAHTAPQLLAYQTYNPNFTASYAESGPSANIRTMLEFNKHTMHIMNFSLNNPLAVTAYLVKPRYALTTTEFPNTSAAFGGAGVSITSGAAAMKDIFVTAQASAFQNQPASAPNALQPNTTHAQGAGNTYPGQPTSTTSKVPTLGATSEGIYEPGATLFNNRWFCQRFKILKTKKFSIQAGKRAKLTLDMPPRILSPSLMGTVNTQTDVTKAQTYVCPYSFYPHSRFWLCSFHGTPAPYIAKAATYMQAFECPASIVGIYHVEQWCIRNQPNTLPGTAQAYRVSAPQDITTGPPTGPYAFGRTAWTGETATAGVGSTIANIVTE